MSARQTTGLDAARRARHRLAHKHRIRLAIRITVRDAAGNPAHTTLKRR